MAETDLHRQIMVNLIEALGLHFAGQRVYVSGNILLYYERGNPKAQLSPDVLVSLDLEPGRREIYKLWEEGKMPDLVIEVTSKSTSKKDLRTKKELYERLGVREYLLFDPRSEYLEPRFQVYRRQGDAFVSVLVPEVTGYTSPLLNLNFRVVDDELRVAESLEGPLLLTPAEQYQRADREEQRANQEALRAEQEAQRAEQEAQRAEQEAQRAEQEALRAEQEALRAEQEAQRAEQEAQRAEQEAQRAERYAARLRELGIDPDSL